MAEWDFLYLKVLKNEDGSSGGDRAEPTRVMDSLTMPSPSLPQTQLSQSQGLSISAEQQDGPSVLWLFCFFTLVSLHHPIVFPLLHMLCVGTRVGERGSMPGSSWGLLLWSRALPQSLPAQHSTLARFCPAELPPVT